MSCDEGAPFEIICFVVPPLPKRFSTKKNIIEEGSRQHEEVNSMHRRERKIRKVKLCFGGVVRLRAPPFNSRRWGRVEEDGWMIDGNMLILYGVVRYCTGVVGCYQQHSTLLTIESHPMDNHSLYHDEEPPFATTGECILYAVYCMHVSLAGYRYTV